MWSVRSHCPHTRNACSLVCWFGSGRIRTAPSVQLVQASYTARRLLRQCAFAIQLVRRSRVRVSIGNEIFHIEFFFRFSDTGKTPWQLFLFSCWRTNVRLRSDSDTHGQLLRLVCAFASRYVCRFIRLGAHGTNVSRCCAFDIGSPIEN